MLSALIIMVGICVCSFVLSKATITITINHTHKDLSEHKPEPNTVTLTQAQLDELMRKDKVPTFDEVLRSVQESIGGIMDGE
jgi:hypothetical protein